MSHVPGAVDVEWRDTDVTNEEASERAKLQ